MSRNFLILVAMTIAFGIARFVIPVEGVIAKEDIFKDLAHIFVGFLFGCAAYAKNRKELWFLAIGLTVLEVVAFFIRKQ